MLTALQLSALPCRNPHPRGTGPVVPTDVTMCILRLRSDSPVHCTNPCSVKPTARIDIMMVAVPHAS